jgi:hypothetical protein
MRSPKQVTPEEAMAVWSSIENPSARSVAKALSQAGRKVHHSTVSRWAAQGWRPVAYRPHPVVAAKQALDLAAGALTGDPAAGTAILEKRPEREQLDGLSDSEVLRKSGRQLCISTILTCDAFQESGSTLVAENPAEAARLLKALCGALPAAVAAYGEALRSEEHSRRLDKEGTASNDPLVDLLKRLEAAGRLEYHPKPQREARGPGDDPSRPKDSSRDSFALGCSGLAPGGISAASGRGCQAGTRSRRRRADG